MAFGLDYVSGPSVPDLKAAGVTFVCRYLSFVNSLTQGKLLTASEAKALSAAGISIVSNYEWYANRALEGFTSGVQDAQIAASQHVTCGGASTRPIYFSVDVDVAGVQVAAYFQGIASVIGKARTGAYGSFRVLQYLFDTGLITWGWQTYAWSYGAWEPRAHIQQYQNNVLVAGHSVDYDRSIKSDYGQWKVGESTMAVPNGWHLSADGKTLYSPNTKTGGPDIPITGPIMQYVLANNWPPGNVALEVGHHTSALEVSNPSLSSGWVQTFRYARLEIPDVGPMAGKVIWGWLGIELLYLQTIYVNAQTQIGALEQQGRDLEDLLQASVQQVAALKAQVAQLQQEIAAHTPGIEPGKVQNFQQALELQAHDLVQRAQTLESAIIVPLS